MAPLISLRPKKKVRISQHFIVGRTFVTPTTIYVLADTELVGLSPGTYEELWRIDVRPLMATHTIYKEAVVVARAVTPRGAVVLESADVFLAVDDAGAVTWSVAGVPRGARVTGEQVVAPADRALLVIDASSGGRQTIPIPLETDADAGVGMAGPLAVIKSPTGWYCGVDLRQREVIWHRPLDAELAPQLGRSAQTLIPWGSEAGIAMAYAYYAKHLVAFSGMTGAPLWVRPVWIETAMPLVRQSRLYFWPWTPDLPCRVQALQLDSGATVFDVDLAALGEDFNRARQAHSPVVVRNTVIFTTRQGVLLTVRLSDGMPLGWYKHSQYLNAPAVCGEDVLVTSENGHLLIFKVPE